MIIDGNKIAFLIKEEVRTEVVKMQGVSLAVLLVGRDPASVRFVGIKKREAESVGIEMKLIELGEDSSQSDVMEVVSKLVPDQSIDGVIIQLPLPKHLDSEKIISLIPDDKDPDNLKNSPEVLSPVVGSIERIFKEFDVELFNKKIVLLGYGKLVGMPMASWFRRNGVSFETIDRDTDNDARIRALKEADVIISGIGNPGFIKPEDIKDGVVLIDAGTSEAGGKLAGDATLSCASKCALFTPVPGGLGPITVAMLFHNLVNLKKQRLAKGVT